MATMQQQSIETQSNEQQQQVQSSGAPAVRVNLKTTGQDHYQQQWPTMKRYFKKHINKAVVECKHQASFTARRLVGQLRTLDKKARQRMHVSADFVSTDSYNRGGGGGGGGQMQHQQSSHQSYDLSCGQQQSTSGSSRAVLCNVNNPLRNSKRRCKITASVQSYLSRHQYHHYYHPKSHHAYLQAQKRKSLSRNSSFRMSTSSNRHKQQQQQLQQQQQTRQSTVDSNMSNNHHQVAAHDNNNNDDDDDDDDFGWGSDFDDSSSNSSTISSSTINHRQQTDCDKLDQDLDNQNIKSSSGFMKVGKPIKNQRIIEDVIQDRGTIGNFKHISSDCLISPPLLSESAIKYQQPSSSPVNDHLNPARATGQQQQTANSGMGGLRSMLSTQLKHELTRRITKQQQQQQQQPPTTNCNNEHEVVTIANDHHNQSSSDHEWEEDTELDQEEEEEEDDEEDIRSLKARQGFKQIKEKLEAIMDQRLAIYRRSISTPTLQHADALPINDHSNATTADSHNHHNKNIQPNNKCQDASLTSHNNMSGHLNDYNHYLSSSLIVDKPTSSTTITTITTTANTTTTTTPTRYNHSLSSSNHNVHHQKQPQQQQQQHHHQKMMANPHFSGAGATSMSNLPTLVSVSRLQSSQKANHHQPTTLLSTATQITARANVGVTTSSDEQHSDMDYTSEIYHSSQIIANDHNDDDEKHHNIQRDFDQQSHCSSTGSQSSGSQDSGHSTQHSSSNNSELGLKGTCPNVASATTTVASHNSLTAQQHQHQRSMAGTRNPPVEPPSSPSSTVSSNDSGNSSACYAATGGSSSSSSEIHLANSSISRSSKNLDDLYDVVDEALNYDHSVSSSPTTNTITPIAPAIDINVNANNLSHYDCCLPPVPEPSSLSPPLPNALNNCPNNEQHLTNQSQRPLFNSLMFSKQIQNGIKNLRNNVSPKTAKNINTSDILNKSLHIQIKNHNKNSSNDDYNTNSNNNDTINNNGVLNSRVLNNNTLVNNNNKPTITNQPTITVIKREFNVNHQQAMVEELMSKLNKRNYRMMQQQQQQQQQDQQQTLMDHSQDEIDRASELEQLSSQCSPATQSAKSNEVPKPIQQQQQQQQQQNDDSPGEEKRLSLLLEQQRQMSLKLKQKPRSKRKTSNAVNLDSYDYTSTTTKSTSNLISSCDIMTLERQQQQQISSSKSAISLRQLIKNVVDNTEQPNKLSTLTMHVLNRTDSFNSDLAISDGASLSRSISSSSLSSLSSLDNSHKCTITSNTKSKQETPLDPNENNSNEVSVSTNVDYDLINRDSTDDRQLNSGLERRQFNNGDGIKMNKDKSTIGHYLKSLKEFNIPTKFKMPKVKLLTQTTSNQQHDNQHYSNYNMVDGSISTDNNDKRDNERGLINGSIDGLTNHFVTISNRRWKSCHLKGNSNNSARVNQIKDSQEEEQINYQDCFDRHLDNGAGCTSKSNINNNNNSEDLDQNHHQYYAMNSPVRPTLNRLTYFLPEPKNGISPTTLGTYQPEHYNVM